MGVFAYSDVDNASSFALDEKVDAETIARAQKRLMAIQKSISARKLRNSVRPAKLHAMVEGPSKDTDLVWEARLEGMAPEIDGKLYLTEFRRRERRRRSAAARHVATVEITESHDYDLVGRVVEIRRRRTALPRRHLASRQSSAIYFRSWHRARSDVANLVARCLQCSPLQNLSC